MFETDTMIHEAMKELTAELAATGDGDESPVGQTGTATLAWAERSARHAAAAAVAAWIRVRSIAHLVEAAELATNAEGEG